MANQINNNPNEETFLKNLINYFYKKILKTELFIYEDLDQNEIGINKTYVQMTQKEKTYTLKSLKQISTFNRDFESLRIKFINEKDIITNLTNFKMYIGRDYKKGFYYKKAVLSFVLRFLILISQILITFLFMYPKYLCIEQKIDEVDEIFWINNNEKCKVIELKKDRTFYLKILIYFLDIIFTLVELSVLVNLQKIKSNKCLIIILQGFKFLIFEIIIGFDFFTENLCEKSKNNSNLFYIKYNYLELISNIYDILKFFIN